MDRLIASRMGYSAVECLIEARYNVMIGIVNNKSVDSVSIGYDTQMGADPEAGQYNMTLYGRQFWSMLKYLPIGPIQIGPGGCPGYYSPTSGAWIGPWPFPGPAQSGFSS